MFGKKNDEETEYTSEYGNIDQFAGSVDEEGLKEMFRYYLEPDEEILYVSGNGNVNAKTPFENEKFLKIVYKIDDAKILIMKMFVVGAFIVLFGSELLPYKYIGLVMTLRSIIRSIMPLVFIIAIVIFYFIWYIRNCSKISNYAITNRRVINYSYSQWQEMSFNDIINTSARIISGNSGKVTVIAKVTVKAKKINGEVNCATYVIWTLENVEDPLRVKYDLDQAIEEYKAQIIMAKIKRK